jgi:sugar phosphate isomerase/epimerase
MGEQRMTDLMLCNVSVNSVPLRETIPYASAAGFTVMSVTAHAHAKSGMSNAELVTMLDDHGVRVQEVEASFDWLAPVDEELQVRYRPPYDTDELLDVAAALGAETGLAVHFGPPRSLEEAIDAFGTFCDKAADRGLKAALEYAAIATITDLDTAWRIVQGAARPNGGLLVDLWHHRRSHSDDDLLASIPPERIHSVQLSDGTHEPVGTLLEDVQLRRLPGEGAFAVASFVERLLAQGVRCAFGVEVFQPVAGGVDARRAIVALHRSLRSVVPA